MTVELLTYQNVSVMSHVPISNVYGPSSQKRNLSIMFGDGVVCFDKSAILQSLEDAKVEASKQVGNYNE